MGTGHRGELGGRGDPAPFSAGPMVYTQRACAHREQIAAVPVCLLHDENNTCSPEAFVEHTEPSATPSLMSVLLTSLCSQAFCADTVCLSLERTAQALQF